jgi:hypothetical protein
VTQEALVAAETIRGSKPGALLIYTIAFVTGAIVMSFEMLGSRYLNPYFGSGIYTWASLISTVLASLTVGYFIGGWLADRVPSAPVLGSTIVIGSVYVILLPSFAQELLELVLDSVDDVKSGSLLAAMAILFFPVTFLGMYSPFAIRLGVRHGLWRLHGGQHRRHARHDLLPAAHHGIAHAHPAAGRCGSARGFRSDRVSISDAPRRSRACGRPACARKPARGPGANR